MVLSTSLVIDQTNVLSKLPAAVLSIPRAPPSPPPPPPPSPGRTKQVPGLPPYSAAHSAASLMWSRILSNPAGTPLFHVAVPISCDAPSYGMLLGFPSGRSNEKLSRYVGSPQAAPLFPSATVTTASGRASG